MTLDDLLAWQPYKVFEMDSWLMARQEDCGIGFDIEGAKALVERIDREMTEIASEIEPQLPPRPLNKGEIDSWRIPAKPYLKDGSLSSMMEKWMRRTGAVGPTRVERVEWYFVTIDGVDYPVIGGSPTKTHGPMRLSNQGDLKDYLLASGWVPTLWNLKRDERGKPVRDDRGQVIQTTPKMQDQGRLCPNLEELAGELCKPVVRWLSLRNRKSVIEGWLENKRLAWDGRLGAGASSITPTFRKTHAVVANLPKADGKVTLGVEIRSLFRAVRPGYVFVGYDASGLEARVEAHYTYNYPGGREYANELIDGDIHTNTAVKMFAEQLAHLSPEDIHKDHPDIKPLRNKAKTLKYAASLTP